MYGYSKAGELIGARLGDMMPRSDPQNLEYLRAFIRSGYRLTDAESHEVDREGNERYFLNNLIGFISEGRLQARLGLSARYHDQPAGRVRDSGERSPFSQRVRVGDDRYCLLERPADHWRQ